MLFIFGVHEMFDLGHEEFANSEETGAGGDFVAEGFADGGTGERHTCIVEFEEFAEVEELSLCGFGPKVAFEITGGANCCVEHQVEFDRRFKDSASLRVHNFFLHNDFTELFPRVIINLPSIQHSIGKQYLSEVFLIESDFVIR